jgi:hypothetical protein
MENNLLKKIIFQLFYKKVTKEKKFTLEKVKK